MGGREKLLDGVKKTKEGVLSSLVSVQETSPALRNSLATADMFNLGKHPLVCTFFQVACRGRCTGVSHHPSIPF